MRTLEATERRRCACGHVVCHRFTRPTKTGAAASLATMRGSKSVMELAKSAKRAGRRAARQTSTTRKVKARSTSTQPGTMSGEMSALAQSMSAPIDLSVLLSGPSSDGKTSAKQRRKRAKQRRRLRRSSVTTETTDAKSADADARRRARLRATDPRKLLGEYKEELERGDSQSTLGGSLASQHSPGVGGGEQPPSFLPLVPARTTMKVRKTKLSKFERAQVARMDAKFQHGRWNVRVYSWGRGKGGTLGSGRDRSTMAPAVAAITNPATGERVLPAKLTCGDDHTLLLTLKGEVYSCGSSDGTGQGKAGVTLAFTPIPALSAIYVSDIACGESHSAVVTQGGNLYTWGEASCGRLGIGSNTTNLRTPTLVPVLAKKRVVGVACGQRHTVAWTYMDEVFAWGAGKAGQVCVATALCNNPPYFTLTLVARFVVAAWAWRQSRSQPAHCCASFARQRHADDVMWPESHRGCHQVRQAVYVRLGPAWAPRPRR